MTTHILVVDDEPQILHALETTLRGAGYEIETAATGEDALTKAERSARVRPTPSGTGASSSSAGASSRFTQ